MGLGLNAATDPEFKNYRLSSVQNTEINPIHMELIPSNVNDETLSHFKTEFGIWIITSGLREVIERFAIFLDSMHHACQMMACNKHKLEPAEAQRLDKSFRFKGMEDKLSELERRFGIKPKHPDYIVSINQARNCLAHRLGRVGIEDCKQGEALEVKWIGMDFQIELESGKILSANEAVGVVIPEAGAAQLKIVERSKSFPLGTFARFGMHELAEICNFMLGSIQEVTASAIQYANSIGIPFQEKGSDNKSTA
ncbi:MAG: hypothetical protein ACREQA_00535 [Candidatus Binatia bacterium]